MQAQAAHSSHKSVSSVRNIVARFEKLVPFPCTATVIFPPAFPHYSHPVSTKGQTLLAAVRSTSFRYLFEEMQSIVTVLKAAILAAALLFSSLSLSTSSPLSVRMVDAAPASLFNEETLPPHVILFDAEEDSTEGVDSHVAGFVNKRQVVSTTADASSTAPPLGRLKTIHPLHHPNSTHLQPNTLPGKMTNVEGGDVLRGNKFGQIPVVLITYGAFNTGDVEFLSNFVQNLAKSNKKTSWWALSTQYYDEKGHVGWLKLSKVVKCLWRKDTAGVAVPGQRSHHQIPRILENIKTGPKCNLRGDNGEKRGTGGAHRS